MEITLGLRRFRDYLAGPDAPSLSALGRRLGVSTFTVHAWAKAKTRPSHHHRLALQKLLGIPAESWLTKKELKFLETIAV